MVLFAPAMSVGLTHASTKRLLRAKFEKFIETDGTKLMKEFKVPGKLRACVIVPVDVLAVIVAALLK